MNEENPTQLNTANTSAAVSSQNPKSFITDRKQLADSKVFEAFEDLVKKIIDFNDREQSLKARFVLEDMLLNEYPQLAEEAPVLFVKYKKLVVLLKFLLLSTRPWTEIEELIQNHLVEAIAAKIPVHEKLNDVLRVYDDVRLEGEIAESLGKAMLKVTTVLGSGQITRPDGKTVSAFIGNWLRDYDQSALYTLSAGDKRGAIHRVTYLNKSQNTRGLSEENRKLLLNVLELYDWLKYGPSYLVEASGKINPIISKPAAPARPSASDGKPGLVTASDKLASHGASLDLLKSRLAEKEPVAPTALRPPAPVGPKMTPEEIEREVGMVELSAPPVAPRPPLVRKEEVLPKPLVAKVQTINFAPKSQVLSAPIPPMAARNVEKPAASSTIKVIDDLKKLNVAYLRAGTLESQISHLKSLISNLARSNNVLPYHVVLAYEQSPLFAAYLKAGTAKITNVPGSGDLTQVEFEALADLRKEVEHI